MRKNEFYTINELAKDMKKRITTANREVEYELANEDVMLVKLSYRKYHISRYDKMGKLVKADRVKTDGNVEEVLKIVMDL